MAGLGRGYEKGRCDKINVKTMLFMRLAMFILGSFLFINGCKTPFIISQKSLENNPCLTSEPDTGVKIRIKNDSKLYFSKFIYKIDSADYEFSGLRPGDITCYKMLPRLWPNKSYEIWFYTSSFSFKKFRKVQKGYTVQVTEKNSVGSRTIMEGYQTINVKVEKDSTNKIYISKIEFTTDKEW